MSPVCPRCHAVYTGSACPACGVSLLTRTLPDWEESPPPAAMAGRWHQTPVGRLFAGLLLALGFGYGLLQLGASLVLVWASETLPLSVGWGLLLALPGLAVLLGSLFAAIGARHGKTYGGVIGLLSGGIALAAIQSGSFYVLAAPYVSSLADSAADGTTNLGRTPLGKDFVYLVPLFFMVCGAAGGALGSRVWKIPARLRLPQFSRYVERPFQNLPSSAGYRPRPAPPAPSPWTGPAAWVRVLVGILVACGVALVHKPIIDAFVAFAGIKIADSAERALAVKEVFALAMLLGGCIAGATTANGLKQGLLVGIGAGLGQALILLGIARAPGAAEQIFLIMLSALFLAPLGGWFGSSLLPPMPPPRETAGE